jgi:hypothetical protein
MVLPPMAYGVAVGFPTTGCVAISAQMLAVVANTAQKARTWKLIVNPVEA